MTKERLDEIREAAARDDFHTWDFKQATEELLELIDSLTPQSVAEAVAARLPKWTNVYDVELTTTTNGCRARAVIGKKRRSEIAGLGATLREAVDDLLDRAERWEPST